MIKIMVNEKSSFVRESDIYVDNIKCPKMRVFPDKDTLIKSLKEDTGNALVAKKADYIVNDMKFFSRSDLNKFADFLIEDGHASSTCTRAINILETCSIAVNGIRVNTGVKSFVNIFPYDNVEINGEKVSYETAVVKIRELTLTRVKNGGEVMSSDKVAELVERLIDASASKDSEQLQKQLTESKLALEFFRINKDIDDKKIGALNYIDNQLGSVEKNIISFRNNIEKNMVGYKDDTLSAVKKYAEDTDKQLSEYMECRSENLKLKHKLEMSKLETKTTEDKMKYYKKKSSDFDFVMMRVTRILVEMDGHFAGAYGLLCDKFFEGELTKATYEAYLRSKKNELYAELKKIYKKDENMLTKESTDSILNYIEKELEGVKEVKTELADMQSTEEQLSNEHISPISELLGKIRMFKKTKKTREEQEDGE